MALAWATIWSPAALPLDFTPEMLRGPAPSRLTSAAAPGWSQAPRVRSFFRPSTTS
ncbi:Uncharacterised protein [Bordetella pertussis]|nr:Uncharacterised protein [Bordetella pertussis]CFT90377.1 Uncharacterised protein [Bordetella pertussis]CFV96359.1 Uncharacterised protein [Bordetella pertussis]CFW29199.1 Uncharacterised protein [Bordetella pertussis]